MADAKAKTKRLQKRRKVFVNEYSDGLLLLATKLSRKEAVKGRCGLKARTVCFIESRPGDVVLSREDVAEMRELETKSDAKREAEAIARLRKLVDESLDGSPVSEQMLSNGPVAEMLADLRALLDAHATLKTAHTKALGVVLSLEFGGRDQKCPVCVGWDMSPRGETPLKHTADCALAAVLAKAGRR